MAYLDDHPPARSQFLCPRRAGASGVVVVHTAENTPDFVAFDGGAEAVARFIQGRSDAGSYHDLADSDSCIQLVRYDCEAFQDGTGSNSHAYGVSGATRADVWPLAPQAWRDGCVWQMAAAAARYATWLRNRTGIVIPARRISRAESDARVPGFISHAERDPTRRSDPGASFPWDQFLDTYAQLTAQEDDMQADERAALFAIKSYLEGTTPEDGDRIADLWNRDGAILTNTEAIRANLEGVTGDRIGDLWKLLGLVLAETDVDEAELAQHVLASLTPEAIAAAIPATIASDVADELHARLSG